MAEPGVLCPSGKCQEGSLLLGIVEADGRVGFLGEPLRVDEDFVVKAKEGRAPERRFRFSSRCLETGCRQWTGSRCGVIDGVMAEAGPQETGVGLPACGIRPQCRWFRQSGAEACGVCPFVITDTTEPQ